ncbi:MAG: hypothetical protein ACFFCV_07020 [Promethearchaeota archaeon]
MQVDSFRISINLIDENTNDKKFIKNLMQEYYSDAFLEYFYQRDNKNKLELIIRNNPLGLFTIKKLIERFHPWIKIYGQKQLIKPDFPKEFWKPINEGGIGKKWSKKVEARILKLDWKI